MSVSITQLKRAGEDCRVKTARVKLERWKRDQAIRRALAEGMSPTAVAHAAGLSRQMVHHISNKNGAI